LLLAPVSGDPLKEPRPGADWVAVSYRGSTPTDRLLPFPFIACSLGKVMTL
jgi:hypothetical protein